MSFSNNLNAVRVQTERENPSQPFHGLRVLSVSGIIASMIDEARSLPLPLLHLHSSARTFATGISRWEQGKEKENNVNICVRFLFTFTMRERGEMSVKVND